MHCVRRRDERGSMSVEVVIMVPIMMMLTMLVLMGGRLVGARADIDAAARDAARAASYARSFGAAQNAAAAAVQGELRGHRTCTGATLDPQAWGQGTATVRLTCAVDMSGLGLLIGGGDVAVKTTGSAPLDFYRRSE